MEKVFIGVICTLFIALVYNLGYAVANSDNSWECDNIGQFYVGKKVYLCERKRGT